MSESTDKQFESINKIMGDNFISKETYTVNGVTPEFTWYETKRILQDLDGIHSRINHLSKVMEGLRENHMKIIDDLMRENKALKAQLKEKQ